MRFDSKVEDKIISLLFHEPRRSFTANELTMRAGSSAGRVRATLGEFLKQRLVMVTERQQLRSYRINRHGSAWEELQDLLGSSLHRSRRAGRGGQDPVERLVSSLPHLKFAALAGIYIGRPTAAVDLLLVGDIPGGRLQRVIRALEELHGGEINYAAFSEPEFQQRQYSYDWFVKEVLDHDPIILVDKLKHRPVKAEKYLKTVFSKVSDRE